MDYVVVVQAPGFQTGPTSFATESAFANHLKELKESIGPRFERLVIVAPEMSRESYEQARKHLAVLSEADDHIKFVPAYPLTMSRPRFLLTRIIPTWRLLSRVIKTAGVVHSGMATQLGHPVMAIANLVAWRQNKVVVFMVDIDFRTHARRFYQTGQWGLKSYLINRYVYDPLKWLQVWLAPRMFQVVYLKSASMVRDFGKGRPNVMNFYDTVHAEKDVLSDATVEARAQQIRDPKTPLTAVYFGRFASNKGIDRMIDAVKFAREQGANVRLTLIGSGECHDALRAQIESSKLAEHVTIVPPVPYGAPLFGLLEQAHVCLAAPLIEDTPRAAFDAMARGLPIVAFGITYFSDLAEGSGAVEVVTWPSAKAMGEGLVKLDRDRERVVAMSRKGVRFARENTQTMWLEKRKNAMLAALDAANGASPQRTLRTQ